MSDIHALAEFGSQGVLCLMSDSTRAESPGYTPSERIVGEVFRDIMEGLDGRIIVATFASNIARIQQVFDAAATFDRKVAVIGRSMEQNVRIASDLGYLNFPESQLVQKDRLKDIADRELVIATTGAQGEPMAGLARMANRDHRWVEIQPGDTVIVSASPIPGNEEVVGRTIDNLFKVGANVYYHDIKRAHVSGHASQEELKLMLNLTRPRHFIPIHGEFRMLVQHGRLAAELGVAPSNIFIIENGQPIEITSDGAARRGAPVDAGYVYVDGLSVGEVGDVVLRDRRALASDGMFLVVVTVDKQTGNLIGSPEIVTRGFVAGPEDPVIAAAADRVSRPSRTRRPHQRARPAQGADQRQPVAVSVRTDEEAADGLPGRGGDLARRGNPCTPVHNVSPRTRRSSTQSFMDSLRVPPHVARSLIGLTLIVIGAVTVIALLFPDAGVFNRYVDGLLARQSGRAPWLLAILLIVAGVVVERPSQLGYGSTLAILGGLIVFVAGLGLIHLVWGTGDGPRQLGAGGGALGNGLSTVLSDLLSPIGAFVVLVGLIIGGLILLLNVRCAACSARWRVAAGFWPASLPRLRGHSLGQRPTQPRAATTRRRSSPPDPATPPTESPTSKPDQSRRLHARLRR